VSVDRDRDFCGRPRSARPRDAAGRPLATGSSGVPEESYDDRTACPETLDEAQALLDADRPFAAHEVLEAAWKGAEAGERDFWQGLAQLAVGLTHAQRGNATGAAALLRRGAERLAPYDEQDPYGVPISEAVHRANDLANAIQAGGVGSPHRPSIRFR
jgi:hypothetical protein